MNDREAHKPRQASGPVAAVARFGSALFRSFADSGVTPNQVTIAGFVVILANSIVYLIVRDPFWLGAGLALSFTADALDGAVARYQQRTSRFGAYLDAVIDRYEEVAVFLAIGLVTGWWVEVFLIVTGSMLISYNKARAAMEMPVDNKNWPDLLERARRLWILCIALIVDGVVPWPSQLGGSFLYATLILLAVMTHFSAIQRFVRAHRLLTQRVTSEDEDR